jgi:hypothetical protein
VKVYSDGRVGPTARCIRKTTERVSALDWKHRINVISVQVSFDITHIFHEAMLHFVCTMEFTRHPQTDSFNQKFVIDKK